MSFNRIVSRLGLWIWSVAVLTSTLIGFPLQAFGQRPIKTTLCAIIKNPQRFHRVLVQFQAHIEVGFENSLLLDPANCDKGISPSFPQKLEEEELKNACTDNPGTTGKANTAIWVGVFRYHPNSVPAWTLDVRKMRVLTFTCESPLEPSNDPIRLPESAPPIPPPSK